MTKEELIKELKQQLNNGDQEDAHMAADNLLLQYINDKEIEDAYNMIDKWYS